MNNLTLLFKPVGSVIFEEPKVTISFCSDGDKMRIFDYLLIVKYILPRLEPLGQVFLFM